jgi:predicted alpha/beta-fold hydrolase
MLANTIPLPLPLPNASVFRTKLYAVGYSMGANVLVKYLGEEGSKTPLSAAVAVSNPFKLLTSAYALQSSSLGMIYSRAIASAARKFTKRHQHVLEKLSQETNATSSYSSGSSPSASPVIGKELVKGALSAKTLWDFDRYATAQMWGFPSVESYYYESSSALFIPNIQVPLLCINALDDPLVPQQCLPYEEIMKSDSVVLLTTEKGGHVAWLEDNFPFALNSSWADFTTLRYLSVIHRLLYAPSASSAAFSSSASPSSSLRNVSGSSFSPPTKTKQEQEQFYFASLFPTF